MKNNDREPGIVGVYRRMLYMAVMMISALLLGGCAQTIADAMFADQYLKPITKSRQVSAESQRAAVNAAVSAAGKTEWTPKTISVETGYMFAEWTPTVGGMNAARNYAFKLEARLPENGKGDATVVITPPQGLISSKISMDELATKYLNALDVEVKSKKK